MGKRNDPVVIYSQPIHKHVPLSFELHSLSGDLDKSFGT
jgi:hypothetical protein